MSVPEASSSAAAHAAPVEPVASTSALPATGAAPRKRKPDDADLEPLSEVMFRRLTTIKEGDNVLLRLPSDQVKAVVAAKDG
jgi:tRNA (adenine-N(1)-)-methyltransferase non-catalytic subunit